MKWGPVDVIVVMIVGAFLTIQVAAFMKVIITGEPLEPENAKTMREMLISEIAIALLYVGNQMNKTKK